jgi:hypothetical protein
MTIKRWILVLGIILGVARISVSLADIDTGYFMDVFIALYLFFSLWFIDNKIPAKVSFIASMNRGLLVSVTSIVCFETYKIITSRNDLDGSYFVDRLIVVLTILFISIWITTIYYFIYRNKNVSDAEM